MSEHDEPFRADRPGVPGQWAAQPAGPSVNRPSGPAGPESTSPRPDPAAVRADQGISGGADQGLSGDGDNKPAAAERVDDRTGSIADLDRIARLPLGEQPVAYQQILDDLQRSLAEIDEA